MGFLSRLKNLHRPRDRAYGGLWDNTNTPGSKGFPTHTVEPWSSESSGTLNSTVRGPNPEPYLQTGFSMSPYRMHSPRISQQPEIPVKSPTTNVGGGIYNQDRASSTAQQGQLLPPSLPVMGLAPDQTRQRDTLWDGANPNVIRTDQAYTASQRYFNERIDLGPYLVPSPSQYAHSIEANIYPGQRGWFQTFVPDPGMRMDQVGISPPVQLSRPIHSDTKQVLAVSETRSAVTKVSAPKRNRSGS